VRATQQFASVAPLLLQLERHAAEVLTAQLKAGAVALTEGRSAAARDAFTLAQKLDPANRLASVGLKRANTLDEVLKLLAAAGQAEKEGDVAAAMVGYRHALALDAETSRAGEGLARVQSRIAGDAFATAMAQGFAALTKADYAAARRAFESAGKVRPGVAEVTQALKQVEQDERTRTITAKLDSARQLEAQEKWAEALNEYRSVTQLDSTVTAASEGIARTTPRNELHQQLEVYLTQPERLFSAPVRSAAKESLKQAHAIAAPGPILSKQMTTLAEWLARAEVPVPIALQSDNLTQVTIRRVADLGVFEQRSLALAPGNYIVVGTRPGYRDVRREIIVVPGAPPAPLIIRCEEKI
jgi:tetratricopeptide (TPR) repeat protein